MLYSLHIQNYILIDSLDVQFPSGLIIITGQTGAGKSILLGALQLIMGAKADVSMIGNNGDTCVVEAVFNISNLEKCKSILKINDLFFEKDENGCEYITIRRVIGSKGRSRAFLNDEPISLPVLSELSDSLLDIHSQNQVQLLTDSDFQLNLIDFFANDSNSNHRVDLSSYKNIWKSYQKCIKEYDTLLANRGKLILDREFNQSLLDRLNKANLSSFSEISDLEEEQKILSNAEYIKSNLYSVIQNLSEPEYGNDITTSIKEAEKSLQKVQEFLPNCGELAQRLESIRYDLNDIISDIQSAYSDVAVNPERLQEVDDRISLLLNLLKVHNVSDIESLISIKQELEHKLESTDNIDEEIERLEKLKDSQYKELTLLADKISKSRVEASQKLSKLVVDGLRFLELERAVFAVDFSVCNELSASGIDNPKFVFSSTGSNLVDISKCASGGERSRIMLVLKSIMAKFTDMPTMIFDEIDTGVSGSVADKMGEMICRMSSNMQVFAITHLPQVAAKGEAHYVISKSIDGDNTRSSIKEVSGNERIKEVARMLSGATITNIAIENAKELLGVK